MNTKLDSDAVARAIDEMRRTELENAAREVIGECEYFKAADLEVFTGTRASTWRYWSSIRKGPASLLLGRRRVWKRSSVIQWLLDQERTAQVAYDTGPAKR